ncbi:ester cyclase [Aliiroseovarius subalbicans]|uniref:nuclear transport factor 2 family protein n=1 Tax=Aliiroseovarius subalbicans TaxID=2925840 RepID=UPI001F58ACC4|nr:ester cyclase [Aliiroseovarius subalbicans]MCI2401128.1 ester cyclase [Aliiroseovarius subalbicans]
MSARANRPAMGVATDVSHENKARYRQFLSACETGNVERAVTGAFHTEAKINASHPINAAQDGVGYYSDVVAPITTAFQGCTRQNYVVIGGEYLGTEWVTSTGYFHGHFTRPLFGIPPSGKLAFLRFGEFHRMEHGKIVESHVFLGFAELIIALGLWPLANSQGYEGVVPGPATHDGIVVDPADPARSRASADLVEGMLKKLTSEDEAWRPDWHDRMVWYGPGGLGSYATLEAFAAFQRPFELTFDGWGDGSEAGITGVGADCKAGDGDYAFLSGWPMITGVHVRPFLGLAPTGKRVFMRDCDWWRCEDGKIIENWCMLDIPHVLMQLGYDLFAEVEKAA